MVGYTFLCTCGLASEAKATPAACSASAVTGSDISKMLAELTGAQGVVVGRRRVAEASV